MRYGTIWEAAHQLSVAKDVKDVARVRSQFSYETWQEIVKRAKSLRV